MVEAAPGQSPGDPIHKHEPRFVRIKVPSLVPRFVPVGKLESKFVLLEELIEANRDSLFPGMITGECHRFRVTRDADIDIREDEAQDLLGVLQQELASAASVRPCDSKFREHAAGNDHVSDAVAWPRR